MKVVFDGNFVDEIDHCHLYLMNPYLTSRSVCCSNMAAETRGLDLQMDSLQFYGKLLTEIPREEACVLEARRYKLAPPNDGQRCTACLRQTFDRVRKLQTFENCLVNSDAQIRWIADENMIMNGLTKDNHVKLFFFLEPNEKRASVTGDKSRHYT